jgi:AraC family transcriptional regulator of adaptative response / DNA-3-methyladenine glycosylase II
LLFVPLDPEHCYRALCARDRRFDGTFFVAVTTTGIYCRPICPARTPGKPRCRFYALAAEAERAGYRACFRCRPERAPGHAPVDAAPLLVRRALTAIGDGSLDRGSVDGLASELGVSGRHLRRTIERALGTSPLELAQTRRLGLAKQLLQDTTLPITDVAYASGFSSLRRFNDAFRVRFAAPPTSVRRAAAETPSASATLRLETRPPFAPSVLFRYFAGRALPGLEDADDQRYRRLVLRGQTSGWIELRADERPGILMTVDPALLPHLGELASRVRRMFDLDARPDLVDARLHEDPLLAPMVERTPGMRMPGAFDTWETLVRAVLAQQVSTKAAQTLCARLIERHGEPLEHHPARRFPTAARLAGARDLQKIGLTGARADTLRRLSRRVADGKIDLSPSADRAATRIALTAVPGIGDWTAQVYALRALRDPDAFLPGDLAIRRAVGRVPAGELAKRAERWRPWRAYALMHLWNTDRGNDR